MIWTHYLRKTTAKFRVIRQCFTGGIPFQKTDTCYTLSFTNLLNPFVTMYYSSTSFPSFKVWLLYWHSGCVLEPMLLLPDPQYPRVQGTVIGPERTSLLRKVLRLCTSLLYFHQAAKYCATFLDSNGVNIHFSSMMKLFNSCCLLASICPFSV